jgi:hypothetical protein
MSRFHALWVHDRRRLFGKEQQFGGGELVVLRFLERGERHDADIAAVADHAGAVAVQVLLVGLGQARFAERAGVMHRARQQRVGIDRAPLQVTDDLRVQARCTPLAGEQPFRLGQVAGGYEEPVHGQVHAGGAALQVDRQAVEAARDHRLERFDEARDRRLGDARLLADGRLDRVVAEYEHSPWILIVAWVLLAIVGFAIEGLLWLAAVGIVLFIGTIVFGLIRRRAGHSAT